MKKKICIVEDNEKIRDELNIFLTVNDYDCVAPPITDHLLSDILQLQPHLILLDLNLPITNGFELSRMLRKESDLPIIVVTSRDSESDEMLAMHVGADDFVTKPFNTQILLLRIASVLKRVYKETPNDIVELGDFRIHLSKSLLEYETNTIDLTKNELKILTALAEKRGRIVTRDELMTQLWNSDLFVDDNTLTVNINRLRKKLADIGLDGKIETKRGMGYLMQ
ncbi:MAG: response regulator transcription factor [Anaerofustis sp.]